MGSDGEGRDTGVDKTQPGPGGEDKGTSGDSAGPGPTEPGPKGGAKYKPWQKKAEKGSKTPFFEKDKQRLGKELYFQYRPRAEIAEACGVSLETVRSWVKKHGWYDQREGINSELLTEVTARRAFHLNKIAAVSIEVLSKALSEVNKRDKPPTVSEAYQISNMLANLDKMARLASGKPTEITEHKGEGLAAISIKTVDDIKKALKGDPMMDVTDAVYKKINAAEKIGNFDGTKAIADQADGFVEKLVEEAEYEDG